MSSIATPFLYRNLVLDFSYDTYTYADILELFEAVIMCEGLRFVKTLQIGRLSGKMVAFFGRLISRLQDHSLLSFKWSQGCPPLDSQLLYIWEHQLNIQYIDFGQLHNVKWTRPWKVLKFPQKYVEVSITLPLEDDFLARFDLSCMRSLKIFMHLRVERIPSCISANMVHITNLQLWFVPLAIDIQLDRISDLMSLGIYSCDGTSSILSNFRNPKLKEFRLELQRKDSFRDSVEAISFIKGFQGLETLMVYLPDERLLKNWMDPISTAHNGTLRNLALLYNSYVGRSNYFNLTEGYEDYVYDAVMACPRLVQLELPSTWGQMEMNFKV